MKSVFDWKSRPPTHVPPSRGRLYRIKGLFDVERQPNAITIIPRASANHNADRRDALKRGGI
ncbi:hypothetical protein NF681_11315 [Comamonadaceae bacterium OTU4NAUVB1]|nr:hypothetical protein NF681_11315 [Comamonadaceae bacterium OTU4NAUVB1]